MYRRRPFYQDILLFWLELTIYTKRKVFSLSYFLEGSKNWLVSRLLYRRGMLSRPITHLSLIAFSLAIVFIGVVFSKTGVFSSSSVAARQTLVTRLAAPIDAEERSVIPTSVNPVTQISDKPRDQILNYEVQSGETISQIATKFGVDTNTIRWENNLNDIDKVKPGDTLKILPVSGVAHTVASGDTIYSVADKYHANPQAIADWPFNNIDESLKLKVGEVLIIPDGVPPTKPVPSRPAPQYVAQGKSPQSSVKQGSDTRSDTQKESGGPLGFIWPVGGIITQYRTAYHTGIDIAGPVGTPVVAAGAGTVTFAAKEAYGYGWHVIIDNGGGYSTLYAHLSRIDVSVGQSVGKGGQVGLRGNTGRSTGPHTHFEVRKGGFPMNPLDYLK